MALEINCIRSHKCNRVSAALNLLMLLKYIFLIRIYFCLAKVDMLEFKINIYQGQDYYVIRKLVDF